MVGSLDMDARSNNTARGEPDELRVVCLATQGSGSGDERRITFLLEPLGPTVLPVDRSRRHRLPLAIWRTIRKERPDIVVLEGTGAGGGAGVIAARVSTKLPYVVSSGDAVAPFLRAFYPMSWPAAALYERMLYRLCAGYIGWSPYLVGRALALGAPRGMTAAHYARDAARLSARDAVRSRLGLSPETVVIGIVGSILPDPRHGYSYGQELVRAIRRVDRADVALLVVGGGDGLAHLAELAGADLGRRVVLTGGCPPEDVQDYLAAMDIAALSQSTDLVGALRYTTKLPEYLEAGLPVITLQTPAAYDLDTGWMWRLPGDAPWDERHVSALAALMRGIRHEDIARKKVHVPQRLPAFDPSLQQERVCAFVRDVARRAQGVE